MYWAVINANAILALRCCLLSGQYEDFWANRADTSRFPPAIQTPLILYRTVEPVMAQNHALGYKDAAALHDLAL